MIGTIRKHSKWLLWIIAGATIFSFVFFMGTGPARNGGGGSGRVDTNIISGTIYGKKVTADMYARASHDVDLYFLFNYGEWATRNPNITKDRLAREIYVRMMLLQKAKNIGIHADEDQVEQAAASYMRSPELIRALQVRSQSVPFNAFLQQILEPHDLTDVDFQNFVSDDLMINQLQLTYGMPGLLITPQEAANEYVRENQELSAQIVFFSASNFLHQVSLPPGVVGQFYTNYMAEYRLPDRVKVSYVFFSLTNYLPRAQSELTNLDTQVNNIYTQYGMQATPDAKTPEDSKAEIRRELIRRQALVDANQAAGDFAQIVFNVTPVSPGNLATVARQKGLPVETPAPFAADYGPQDVDVPPTFTKTAFELTPDGPISEPLVGPAGVYIIALDQQLPSEIPPLDEIRDRVARDLRTREATFFAQRAGTNFAIKLTLQMATGKSFAAATIANGFDPEVLPPFSLLTQEMPELGNVLTLNQLKQVAMTTPVGTSSGFKATDEGGFVLYVESRLPVDQSKMASDLPEFTAQLRQQRQSQTFNDWLQREASRELRNTPVFRQSAE